MVSIFSKRSFFRLPLMAVFLVSLVFAFCHEAAAQKQSRIGIIDVQRVLIHSKAGKKARASFEKEFKKKQAILDKKSAQYDKMEKDFTKNLSVMNEDTLKRKSSEIEKKKKELLRAREDFTDELKKRDAEMRRKISQQIQNVVNQLGKSDGYSVILAKSGVLFVSDGVDITEKVIEMYDNKY
ncbi:MAG: OmpH family outer membrane protein [Thermodesulfobacteriota bacterium]